MRNVIRLKALGWKLKNMLKFNNGKLQESYSMAESSRTCIIDLQVNR